MTALLTLPPEIRVLIWEYCLVSPTHRVLPVCYRTFPASDPPSPFVWTATRPFPIPPSANNDNYATALRIAFNKTLDLVPCAPTTEGPLSPSLLPLAHLLPLVNRQVHAETAGRFWGANTLVLPDYAAGREVLEYLGSASKGIQRVEMAIGNVWDVERWQGWEVLMTLNHLERLVRQGALQMLRLKYVDGIDDGNRSKSKAYSLWYYMLLENREESDWGGCRREVVWDKKRSDKLMHQFARSWGLEESAEEEEVTASQMRMIKSRNW